MASLLGGMLEVCFDEIVCNGFSMSDGSPVVSSSHLNEKNDDKRYLRKDRSGKILDLTTTPHELDIKRQIAWNEALYKFGWKSLLGWPYKIGGTYMIYPILRNTLTIIINYIYKDIHPT